LINTNDCNGPFTNYGGSEATYTAALAAYCDARRTAGYKMVLCTILPRGGGGFNTARNSVNTTIRGWVGTHIDAVCDFAADPNMGADGQNTDTTYYDGDAIHPNATGQARLETIYRAVINAL
jgi:hypothetical protein